MFVMIWLCLLCGCLSVGGYAVGVGVLGLVWLLGEFVAMWFGFVAVVCFMVLMGCFGYAWFVAVVVWFCCCNSVVLFDYL